MIISQSIKTKYWYLVSRSVGVTHFWPHRLTMYVCQCLYHSNSIETLFFHLGKRFTFFHLTLSWRRSLSYRWFLYGRGLHHERVTQEISFFSIRLEFHFHSDFSFQFFTFRLETFAYLYCTHQLTIHIVGSCHRKGGIPPKMSGTSNFYYWKFPCSLYYCFLV